MHAVRVFWLKPTDVAHDQAHPDGIASVLREAQRFYKHQLGKTFTLNSTVVETVNGLHDTNWYIATRAPRAAAPSDRPPQMAAHRSSRAPRLRQAPPLPTR